MTEQPKPKKKGSSLGQTQFLILWIIGHFAGFLVAVVLSLLLSPVLMGANPFTIGLSQILIIGGVMLWAQKTALQRYAGRTVEGWLKSGIFGWVLGSILSFVLALGLISPAVTSTGDASSLPVWIWMIVYFPALAFPGITHAARLRKHVDNAWLYSLSSIVAALLLPLFISADSTSLLNYAGGITSYALTTGLTLIWLFGMSGGAKLLTDEDTDTLSDATTRLSDEDTSEDERYHPPTSDDQNDQRTLLDKWLTWLRSLRSTPTA